MVVLRTVVNDQKSIVLYGLAAGGLASQLTEVKQQFPHDQVQ